MILRTALKLKAGLKFALYTSGQELLKRGLCTESDRNTIKRRLPHEVLGI